MYIVAFTSAVTLPFHDFLSYIDFPPSVLRFNGKNLQANLIKDKLIKEDITRLKNWGCEGFPRLKLYLACLFRLLDGWSKNSSSPRSRKVKHPFAMQMPPLITHGKFSLAPPAPTSRYVPLFASNYNKIACSRTCYAEFILKSKWSSEGFILLNEHRWVVPSGGF